MELNQSIGHLELVTVQAANPTIASDADYAICREVMQKASRNYSFAGALLPRDKRHHVEALYALMRVGDDRVDVSHSGFRSPLEAIDDWEAAYWKTFDVGDSPYAVLRAYLDTAVRCGIPRETMTPYFRAMRDDLTITRFNRFEDLLYYMDGSAIPVGRAMTHILGVSSPYSLEDALPGADSLSIAMQLSNFWRDIGYDWGIGRVYLPLEDLDSFGYSEADLSYARIDDRLAELLEFEFERTENYYACARASIRMLESGRWAVTTGLEVYRAILADIRHGGYDVFTRRAGASRWRKASLAALAYVRS